MKGKESKGDIFSGRVKGREGEVMGWGGSEGEGEGNIK